MQTAVAMMPNDYDDEGQRLGGERPEHQEEKQKHGNGLSDARRIEVTQDISCIVSNPLRVCLSNLVRQAGSLVGDEMMKVPPEAGNGGIVVVHHGEAKADHQDQAHEICEVKAAPVFARGKQRP